MRLIYIIAFSFLCIAPAHPKPSIDHFFESVGVEFMAYLNDQNAEALRSSVNFEADDPANLTDVFEEALKFVTDERSGRLFCSSVIEYGITDPWWCARALVVIATQPGKDSDELSKVIVAALIEKMNSLPPLDDPPSTCGTRHKNYSGTRWNDSADDVWFRDRSAFWVECKDGSIMVYLPERGWFVPPIGFRVR